MEMKNKSSNGKINSLMGLRFLFALGIFIHHFDMFSDMNIPDYDKFKSIFFEGFIGVNFFYILSGFIISYCYMEKMRQKEIGPGEFIFKRFARIWPVHILTFIIAIISYTSSFTALFSKAGIINLAMMQSYIPLDGYAFNFNGVSWSLSTEMFFYISFCFLVFLPEKYIRYLFGILVSIMFVCFFQGINNIQNPLWFIYINPGFRIIDFLAGILINQLFAKNNFKNLSIKQATSLEIGSLVFLLIMFYLGVKQSFSVFLRYDLYYLLPISVLVYVFAINRGIVSKILGNRFLVYLGECSFTFYMIHQIILALIKRNFYNEITSMVEVFKWGGLALIITLILSICLCHLYEIPASKFLLKLRYGIIKLLKSKKQLEL